MDIDKKFVIVDKEVSEKSFNIFEDAFNRYSKRIYVNQLPTFTIDFLIKELLRISGNVEAIQIEFDRYNGGYNIEFEIYLLNGDFGKIVSSVFETKHSPQSVAVSEHFYFEFIKKLKEQNC